LDRFDASSKFGGELSYLFPNHTTGSVTALRAELHGQYVDPASGFGAYAQLPVGYVRESDMGMTQSGTGLGDLELGGLYVPHVANPDLAIVLRAGITLPSGSTGSDAETANLAAAFTRLNDYYLAVPGGLSGRFSGSLLARSGKLFVRADLGLDANKSADGNANVDAVVHLNAGVGADLGGGLDIMGEVVNLYDTGDNGNTSGSSWINAAAVSMRLYTGTVQPYAALVLPLDDDASSLMTAALTVGLEGTLE
jgi:hypothetical protein